MRRSLKADGPNTSQYVGSSRNRDRDLTESGANKRRHRVVTGEPEAGTTRHMQIITTEALLVRSVAALSSSF